MTFKRQQLLTCIIFVVVCAGFIIYFKTIDEGSVVLGKVVTYTTSLCAHDVASPSCGPYSVDFESLDNNYMYTVAGYKNGQSDHYDLISKEILKAKEQDATVSLSINSQSEIISVH